MYQSITFHRPKTAAAKLGCGPSKLYKDVRAGIVPRPLKNGPASVWPEHELDSINAAVIAGYSNDERRELVKALESARANIDVLPQQAA